MKVDGARSFVRGGGSSVGLRSAPRTAAALGGGLGARCPRRTRPTSGRSRPVAPRSGFAFEDVVETETLELFSPAKINLFLRITKRRDDGFHELASLFQTIAFGDTLRITKLPSTALEDEIDAWIADNGLDDQRAA